MENTHLLLGAHTSIQGGVNTAIPLAEKLGFTAIQIFTANNNRWEGKKITDSEGREFKERQNNTVIKFIVSHDSYLINLCSPDETKLEKSRIAFIEEIERCELLNLPYLNFHPGLHLGMGEEWGISKIAESINNAHCQTQGFKVNTMLEATAGQGSSIGHKFEHLAEIIDKVEDHSRISVCIDTAHIFAAGYDISNNYESVISEFDRVVGLDKLRCFHINDSKKALGTKVDRHEHIGKGYIGLKGFANIMNDIRLLHIPKILETPKGKEQLEDLENLAILRSLIL